MVIYFFKVFIRQGSYLNYSWGLGLQVQGIFIYWWVMYVVYVGVLFFLRFCVFVWDCKVFNFYLLILVEFNIQVIMVYLQRDKIYWRIRFINKFCFCFIVSCQLGVELKVKMVSLDIDRYIYCMYYIVDIEV